MTMVIRTHLNLVIAKAGPVLVRTPQWVRAQLGSTFIADSKRVILVREPGTLPVFAFPRADVRMDHIMVSDATRENPTLGPVQDLALRVGDRVFPGVAWTWTSPPEEHADLAQHIAFQWDAMDHWYEEAEEIFRHPRDPFHRVDAIASERHVRITHGGELIAESRRPRLLFETGHPVRFYLPTEDIRMDLLTPSTTSSRCPYKGIASYWQSRVGKVGQDIAWAYQAPIPECPGIRGLVSFFNERVDAIEVDGERLEKPRTSWS